MKRFRSEDISICGLVLMLAAMVFLFVPRTQSAESMIDHDAGAALALASAKPECCTHDAGAALALAGCDCFQTGVCNCTPACNCPAPAAVSAVNPVAEKEALPPTPYQAARALAVEKNKTLIVGVAIEPPAVSGAVIVRLESYPEAKAGDVIWAKAHGVHDMAWYKTTDANGNTTWLAGEYQTAAPFQYSAGFQGGNCANGQCGTGFQNVGSYGAYSPMGGFMSGGGCANGQCGTSGGVRFGGPSFGGSRGGCGPGGCR